MQVEFLIIGQGLCGTWLSWYLQKEKKNFLVIDNNDKNSSSRNAAGVINPVTGRRIVKTWMIDELIPFVEKEYAEIEKELNIKAISQKNIVDFFPTLQMRDAFLKRKEEETFYLQQPNDQENFSSYFNYIFGYGIITPGFVVNIDTLLFAWRKRLHQNNQLREEEFDLSKLHISADKIRYKDIIAEKIIFCDGIASFNNPLFKYLPFAFNKGEALIIEANDLPSVKIFKKSNAIIPLEKPGTFWVGTNFIWNYNNILPTKDFFEKTNQLLKEWLKVPFTIIDHIASVRPANVERRPFTGMHPIHQNAGILNGMGSKGCSLAPYFAKQLSDHILHKKEILPEADIKRLRKILSR